MDGQKPKRIVQYVVGVMITALGVITIIRSDLGAGAWDTVTYNLSALINSTLGTASFITQSTIVLMIIAFRRRLSYLLIFIPIFGISLAIDFWDLVVFRDYYPTAPLLRIGFYLAGLFVLTLGLSLMILSRFKAAVFDELMLLVMDLFKTRNVFITRLGVELSAIVIGSIIGFIAGIGFGAVNVGSFILAVVLPPVLALQLKWLKPLFDYEKEGK